MTVEISTVVAAWHAVRVIADATVNGDGVAAVRVAAVHLAAVMAVGACDGYYVTSRISCNPYLYCIFNFLKMR
jgi:hypothetical protein